MHDKKTFVKTCCCKSTIFGSGFILAITATTVLILQTALFWLVTKPE